MKGTSSYAFSLVLVVFSWTTKKQATVAQSTKEAKYVVAAKDTSKLNGFK